MCYDLHAFAYYDPFTGFNSPLYSEQHDTIYGNRSIVSSLPLFLHPLKALIFNLFIIILSNQDIKGGGLFV